MLSDHKSGRDRVARFIESCVIPSRYRPIEDFSAAVFQTAEPCGFSQACAAEYQPVQPGFHFGPTWSTAWFRFGVRLPDVAPNQLVALIDTNTEACVWLDGVPFHGLSEFHKAVPLDERFITAGEIELYVEAAANQLWGADQFRGRYTEEPIGLLREARLAERLPEVEQLAHDMQFALQLVDLLEPGEPRRKRLLYALNEAVNAVDALDVAGTVQQARAILKPVLQAPANASASRCHAVGHAHIDVAWLWPLRETRRKSYRTFATMLRLMERYPDFKFQQSQAVLYDFVRQDHPDLFAQIRQFVAEGRLDAGGGMWLEPDCNLIRGESLVRQILHGVRFWREHFGIEQTYLWLPDTFGYCAALPQIMKQAGLDTFYSQKMSWNQINRFPHHTFHWVGLDGSRVLAHFLTSDTYNSDCSPKQLRHSERAFAQGDRCHDWLYAYGWGDGGGGPTTQMIEALSRSANCEGMPRVQMSTVTEFTETLHADTCNLPTWDGELYLETHRGTLTTHAANKRYNRLAETRLRDAEILHALAPGGLSGYPAEALDEAWKIALLNQFHDILPGSSIHWVYEDSARDYADLNGKLWELEQAGLSAWASAADTSSASKPLVAINTLGWARTEVVALPEALADDVNAVADPLVNAAGLAQTGQDIDGNQERLVVLRDVDPLGHRVFDLAGTSEPSGEEPFVPVQVSTSRLENAYIRLDLDELGRVMSVYDKRVDREVVLPEQPANDLVLYEDRPTVDDAWNVDLSYLEKPLPLPDAAEISVADRGPLRGSIRVKRAINSASYVEQLIRLSAVSGRVDFVTRVHWQADHQLLRVRFPVQIRSNTATYHAQFGYHERPTHFNTSWDLAKFECCGHHWCDVSEPDYGVALLSDCKYGYSCHGNVLGLSLLRAPRHPDPQADRGQHNFTYSLLPHPGDLRSGRVIFAGQELNTPLHLVPAEPHLGARGLQFSALRCNRENVLIDTVKRAEADHRLIVRCYETFGQRGTTTLRWDPTYGTATPIDLLEQPSTRAGFMVDRSEPGSVSWRHRPFGLYSFAINPAGSSNR